MSLIGDSVAKQATKDRRRPDVLAPATSRSSYQQQQQQQQERLGSHFFFVTSKGEDVATRKL
jgi:hypothetical protein